MEGKGEGFRRTFPNRSSEGKNHGTNMGPRNERGIAWIETKPKRKERTSTPTPPPTFFHLPQRITKRTERSPTERPRLLDEWPEKNTTAVETGEKRLTSQRSNNVCYAFLDGYQGNLKCSTRPVPIGTNRCRADMGFYRFGSTDGS